MFALRKLAITLKFILLPLIPNIIGPCSDGPTTAQSVSCNFDQVCAWELTSESPSLHWHYAKGIIDTDALQKTFDVKEKPGIFCVPILSTFVLHLDGNYLVVYGDDNVTTSESAEIASCPISCTK